jgi:hypothetical protein
MAARQAQMHEDFTRHHAVRSGSERALAFVFAGWFGLVGLAPLRHGLPVRSWALFMAAAFAIIGVIRPAALKPLNIVWTKLGMALNRITSPVILLVMFYAGVVPMGLLMRLFGKTPLQLERQPGRPTYWVDRRGASASSMSRQF